MPAIVIAGSANLDQTVYADRHPRPGETVFGNTVHIAPGGKGANQAVAAARLGGRVQLVGCVGDDEAGTRLRHALRAAGVDDTLLVTVPGTPTGLAAITVSKDGENSIVVVPGANDAVTPAHVQAAGTPSIVVVQQEIPAPAVAAAAELAGRAGVRLLLNASPYRPLPADLLATADPLIVNEHEAAALFDCPHPTGQVATLARRCRSVVLTLGASGAICADHTGSHHVPAPSVRAVDTTGAGDAFAGAVAFTLAGGLDLRRATELAVRVAAISVTRPGAQASYPSTKELT
jgi:ribokinase